MAASVKTLPPLDTRFLPPEGWRWHSFKNPKGRNLRFGTVSPKDSIPDAVVIGLPGLSEFAEKYFEVARDLLELNLSFWILDWQGQGKSDRFLTNPHKRHSTGFQQDTADLDYFLREYVKHSAVHPDVGRIPMVMLAHSMGGNIGLRYIHDYPDSFSCAAFTSPMLGIKALERIPFTVSRMLTSMAGLSAGSLYVGGGSDWKESWREEFENNPFSSDPERQKIHNLWCLHDPELQVGSVTFRWVHEALNSCAVLRRRNYPESIKTSCMFTVSGKEKFVDNAAAISAAKRLPDCLLYEEPEARHEILMERDDIRSRFFDNFYKMVKKKVIDKPESLKPF